MEKSGKKLKSICRRRERLEREAAKRRSVGKAMLERRERERGGVKKRAISEVETVERDLGRKVASDARGSRLRDRDW